MTPAAGGSRLVEFAPAKVNLSLQVTGRRSDGYHLLDSLVVFAGVGDELSFEPSPRLELTISGPQAAGLAADASNLVARAASALAKAAGIEPRAAIHLEKRLPVASGIGGGSADAAATLRGVNRLWGLGFDAERLAALGLPLGADLPVCVRGRPTHVSGVGEVLEPLPPLPPAWLVLVNPGQPLPTRDVFLSRTGPFSAPPRLAAWNDAAGLASALTARGNDLTMAACGIVPAITEILETLAVMPGCLLARMSGSGATCFGLFAEQRPAAAAAGSLAAAHPAWWTAAAPLLP